MKAYVAPSEHRTEYGFEIIRDGKIIHSGYATPCNAIELFAITPSAQAALRAEGAKQERGLMLIPLITWLRKKRKYYGTCSGSNANDDPEDCDPYNTVLLKIEFLRQSQSTGGER